MPPREDFILFLDLETTGTDEDKDNIIEVGCSLISTEEGYPEVSSFSAMSYPSDEAYGRMMNKQVVREMHEVNGLLEDLKAVNVRIDKVDEAVVAWLDHNVKGDNSHVPLGGSGVTHFDRRFIKRYMPKLDARLTHWAYDVGVMRRMFMKAGAPYASMDAKTHRALDDARVHADEFRWYQRFIRG